VAAAFFATAVITATLPALVSTLSSDDSALDQAITWDAVSGNLSGQILIRDAPSSATVTVTLVSPERTLVIAQLDVPSTGDLDRTISSAAHSKRPVTMRTVLRDDGKIIDQAETAIP
jgi:hypothetical protein